MHERVIRKSLLATQTNMLSKLKAAKPPIVLPEGLHLAVSGVALGGPRFQAEIPRKWHRQVAADFAAHTPRAQLLAKQLLTT